MPLSKEPHVTQTRVGNDLARANNSTNYDLQKPMHRLANTPPDHPALWGEISVQPKSQIIVENCAIVLPHMKKRGMRYWWFGHQHGAYKQNGNHMADLNDLRGQRQIFYPPEKLEDLEYSKERTINHELLVYAGTVFDHFGHLILDLTRLYQLSRVYRDCNTTIWVHSHSVYPGRGITSPLAQEWLDQLGIRQRIKVICRPIIAKTLVSSSVLYRDRCFVSEDFHAATSTALSEENKQKLLKINRGRVKIAYLSRHKLTSGTTKFIQEARLIEMLKCHHEIDIICPEELSFMQKIELYMRYSILVGFPQACMNLKAFVPKMEGISPAKQVMLVAGPESLSSNWVNIDKACHFNDYYIECPAPEGIIPQQSEEGFQRGNQFNLEEAYSNITSLIGEDIFN